LIGAAPPHEALTFLFTCERVGVPAIDRAALSAHRNGVTGVAGVVAVADDPRRAGEFLDGLCRQGTVEVISGEEGQARFGRPPAEDGLGFVAIRLQTRGLSAIRGLLDSAGIGYTLAERGDIVVPPAPGQGAYLIFEDAS
jgi:hypothetical protein